MGVVDEAVENGVSVGRVPDHLVPRSDGQLAGDDGGTATITFFEDLEQVMAGECIERLEAPIIQDEELHAAEGALEAGMAAIATGECKAGKQLGNALV